MFNKIVRTYPSTASLVLLFKSNKLKHFSSFTDFLVKKIFPVGFIKWTRYNAADKPEPGRLEECWKQREFKDAKTDPLAREDDKLYRV